MLQYFAISFPGEPLWWCKHHCEVSIDEAMVGYKGESSMYETIYAHEINQKGFKRLELCDLNSYTINSSIYTGASEASTGNNLGTRVVKSLSFPLLNIC